MGDNTKVPSRRSFLKWGGATALALAGGGVAYKLTAPPIRGDQSLSDIERNGVGFYSSVRGYACLDIYKDTPGYENIQSISISPKGAEIFYKNGTRKLCELGGNDGKVDLNIEVIGDKKTYMPVLIYVTNEQDGPDGKPVKLKVNLDDSLQSEKRLGDLLGLETRGSSEVSFDMSDVSRPTEIYNASPRNKMVIVGLSPERRDTLRKIDRAHAGYEPVQVDDNLTVSSHSNHYTGFAIDSIGSPDFSLVGAGTQRFSER